MDSLDGITKLMKILSEDSDISDYYGDKLRWADSRKKDWENDKIRVGVIGVTSSGKSTLINALLATDILSSAIAPSSGQLVCCSYGAKYSARIEFEDKEPLVVEDDEFTTSTLMEYSDERYNPGNEKRVRNIEIVSPNFDLGKDVLLIDSPGLDAYGLDIHEKITMETLIPTIDVCIFVGTMKSDSDAKAQDVINVVAKYGCPLVIVQNMLDSVKPSPSGDRTAEEVARGYYSRVKRIIDESDIEDKDNVEIVQISAEYARKWRLRSFKNNTLGITKEQFDKSNYKKLISVVNKFLVAQRPVIEDNRMAIIVDVINDIKQLNDSQITGITPGKKDTKDYKRIRSRINKTDEQAGKMIEEAISKFNIEYDMLSIEIDSADRRNIEKCADNINSTINKTGKDIKTLIEKCNEELIKIAQTLNIPTRDLLKSYSLKTYYDIHVEKEIEAYEYSVEQSGLFGKIKRRLGNLFGNYDWGYEKRPGERTVIDLDKSKKKLQDRLDNAVKYYSSIYDSWYVGNVCGKCKELLFEVSKYEEIERKRKETEIHINKLSKLNERIVSLEKSIIKSKGKYKANKKKKKRNEDGIKTESKIEIDDYVVPMIELARIACRNQHILIMNEFVTRNKLSNRAPIIIGWDDNAIDELKWQSGIKDFTVFKMPKDKIDVSTIKSSKCYFIMVNATQIGSAEKQIRSIELENYMKTGDRIIWVLQDLEELINSANLEEGIQRLILFKEGYMNQYKSYIWMLHRNPLYNLAFIEYQSDMKMSFKEENVFLSDLKTRYREYFDGEVEKNISTILRSNAS